MTRGAALGIAVACLTLTPLHGDDARPPELIQRLLQPPAAWRLLDPRVDLVDADATTLAIIQARPPWIVGDFDHDGRDDVAAVVVSGPPDRRRFGIVAIHAAAPRVPRWIVPLNAERILGVAFGPGRETVEADYCTECDTNPWFRWSGRSYEPGLFGTGDTVALGDEHGADLRAGPLGSAPTRAHVGPCAQARVHDVAGRPGARWYFVETTAQPRARGWVMGRVVLEADGCF